MSSHTEPTGRKKKLILVVGGVLVVLAIVGVILGVSLTKKSDASVSKGDGNTPSKIEGEVSPINPSKASTAPTTPTPSPSPSPSPSISPEDSKFVLSALAIGDWGSTLEKEGGSCCNRRGKVDDLGSQQYARNYWAQKNVARLLANSAGSMKPKPVVVIGHGDNAYWNGVTTFEANDRFDKTFEQVYNHAELNGIPWINVVGNHDLAGSGYLCSDRVNKLKKCTSADEIVKGLDERFDGQATYKSPNNNRWILNGHYYKYTIDAANLTVDIFNVDTNYADSHAAQQICCQCHSYTEAVKSNYDCSNVVAGNEFCAGGDQAMFSACMNHIKGWWDESLTKLEADLKTSKADYTIINTHYSPMHHMSPPKAKKWMDLLEKYKVNVWINGHTHGENHELASFGTHFFQNGAGGGIQSESGGVSPPEFDVNALWSSGSEDFGFFEIHISKEWLKFQFITFDNQWVFNTDPKSIKQGGNKVGYCYYVPKIGAIGKKC